METIINNFWIINNINGFRNSNRWFLRWSFNGCCRRESGAKTNLYAKVLSINDKEVTLIDNDSNIKTISFLNNSSILDLKINQKLIIETSFDRTTKKFTGYRVLLIDPYLVLPLIPQLEERARNLYFHVPTAWLTQLAWFIAFGYAIAYLRTRKLEYDMIAESAAIIGFLFCILATTTGAVWANLIGVNFGIGILDRHPSLL